MWQAQQFLPQHVASSAIFAPTCGNLSSFCPNMWQAEQFLPNMWQAQQFLPQHVGDNFSKFCQNMASTAFFRKDACHD
jgi:hypothetical protein